MQGTFAASKGRQSAETANLVQVNMRVLRLAQQSTDIIITLTTPIAINVLSAAAQDIGAGQKTGHHQAPALFDRMLNTFDIRDWNLFSEG